MLMFQVLVILLPVLEYCLEMLVIKAHSSIYDKQTAM